MNLRAAQQRTAADAVRLDGVLGEAIEASRRGRLSRFITDEDSPAIALFQPARVEANLEGDWYGEHAGKWLIATAKAVAVDLPVVNAVWHATGTRVRSLPVRLDDLLPALP